MDVINTPKPTTEANALSKQEYRDNCRYSRGCKEPMPSSGGGVRVLEAVDVHELHHLVDCLVFPKKGERPHANEASESDLDGDICFVT